MSIFIYYTLQNFPTRPGLVIIMPLIIVSWKILITNNSLAQETEKGKESVLIFNLQFYRLDIFLKIKKPAKLTGSIQKRTKIFQDKINGGKDCRCFGAKSDLIFSASASELTAACPADISSALCTALNAAFALLPS